jgi:hypothetical protein
MRHEAESKCYVAFVNADGTSHPIAEYLEYWQDIPAQSVADAAPDFDRLIYLVRIRLSFEDRTRNTRNNESLESLLLTRFEPTKTTGVKDKWLAEWLRNLSFEDFFLVCRIGSRLVKQPLFREFSDRIIKYIHQKRRRVTSSNYDQAFRLLKTQIHAQDELKRQWDARKYRRPPFR